MFISKKEFDELNNKIFDEQMKYKELQAKMCELLARERYRIDKLLVEIENKFNEHMEKYSKANAILTRQREFPAFRFYTENELAKPIEYGEIFIPALHIRFIKGEK